MGRLPSLIPLSALSVLATLAGCGDGGKPTASTTGRSRSDAVALSPAQAAANASAAPAHTKPAAPAHAEPAAPRVLCADKPLAAGAPLPKVEMAALQSKDAAAALAPLSVGGGQYTWLNFWAGWCEPCKEEIPLLVKLDAQHKNLRVAFISLDDDERQAQQFLDQSARTGMSLSYWLKDTAARKALLAPLQITSLPTMPFHLLFDPSGKLMCRIDGAIDEADLPQLERLLAAPR